MDPIFLQDLAARKTAWLAARQAVVAANVANANTPGFHAKDIAPFKDVLAHTELAMDPGNPAADEKGFVKLPNVNLILEMADMREANRAYEANLQVVKQSRDLISMTIDLLKGSS